MHAPGTIVAGKYRIDRLLGEGGMGHVLAATHMHLGTPVALKILRGDAAENTNLVGRFLREAQASANLRGEHVCRVSDVGTHEGVPFIVMELLYGRDLASVIKQSAPLPVPQIADYMLQACAGIAEAHSLGIVHRDLKPGNLFLTNRPDGRPLVKVLDFGIAKTPTTRDFSLTQTASVMGSPAYMSPEQLKSSKEVDPRADVWSLGVVMFELATGYAPFTAETITELALRVTLDPTPPLPPSVPVAFSNVIDRCLAKDPNKRYRHIAALANALAPFVPHGWDMARGVVHVLGQHAPVLEDTPPAVESVPTTLRGASGSIETVSAPRRSLAIIGGVAVAVVAGVIAGFTVFGGGGGGKAVAPAPTVESPKVESPPPAPPAPPPPAPAPPAVEVTPLPEPTPPAVAPEPAKPAPVKPTPKKKPPGKKKPTLEDIGESRT